MFQPREIIYGYGKSLYSPHHKYIVTIYRDDELNIVACFTTSQSRAGVPEDEIHHGAIYKEKRCVSFVFEKDVKIGVNPATGADFAFPKRSVITFDYGVREGLQESFLKEFENPEVVCMLDEKEYIELVYAMYCSPHTKNTHKKVLNKILEEYYSKRNV